MNKLTEQWRKGELPEGFYWIKFQDGKILPTTFSNQHGFICCDVICYEEKIKQILAEMPSYELWKAVHEQWKVLLKENTKLKEQLKIALRGLNFIVAQSNGKDMFDCAKGTLKQIDEVLK